MVEIDKKYPSQQKPIRKGFSKFLALMSFASLVLEIILLVILSCSIDPALAGSKLEFFKMLWQNFSFIVIAIGIFWIATDILATLAIKVNSGRVSSTYILTLNVIFIVIAIIMALVFAF